MLRGKFALLSQLPPAAVILATDLRQPPLG